jgi:hypothetical protein
MIRLTRHFLCSGLWIALGLGPAASLAAPDTAALARQLASHSPGCGSFNQSRWLADFEIDIKSSGTFVRSDEAIIWRTETPVVTEVHLSAANPDLPPGFRHVVPVMTALLGGEWERLRDHFAIDASGELDVWSAKLTPLDDRVASQLPLIRVTGGEVLESVQMHFADGDRLDLRLQAARCAADPAPPTP